jgi:hypothetical protein
VRRLAAALSSADFGTLENSYSASFEMQDGGTRIITDQDTVTVRARVGSEFKQVRVYGPEVIAGIWHSEVQHPDVDAGRRFCRVWAEILVLVRPPNSWQKARMYRQ